METTDRKPLLSICVPTYNRARFLRVMLQALLPQVKECGSKVEVWVLDNASTDETPQVLEELRDLGPFHIHRQPQNLGSTRNIVHGPLCLANGDYVWILGDHNVLRFAALKRIISHLQECPEYDVLYVNFRVATYPQHWPQAAMGGYDGPFTYLGNPEVEQGPVEQWSKLLRPYSAACTQCYVHVVKTHIWRQSWQAGVTGEDYSSALTTYPHTMTLVNSCFQSPAMVIAEPGITIFNGAQSWRDPISRVKVYYVGLPELLSTIERKGLPPAAVATLWKNFFYPESVRVAKDAFRQLGRRRGGILLLQHLGLRRACWQAFMLALPESLFPRLSMMVTNAKAKLTNYRSWYLYNFRLARWLRRRTAASESPSKAE